MENMKTIILVIQTVTVWLIIFLKIINQLIDISTFPLIYSKITPTGIIHVTNLIGLTNLDILYDYRKKE